jgi:hypothetical protein
VLRFSALSGGEKDRVMLEITLKIAAFYAKFKTTLLIIEKNSFGSLDSEGINQLFKIIRTEELGFQFIFTSLPNKFYDTTSFKVHNLNDILK